MLLVNACTKQQDLTTTQDPNTSAVKDVTTASTSSVSTRIEAEDYTTMSGIEVEDCREGGKDVGYISVGDWMDYTINVNTTGSHTISFRVAGPKSTLQVQKPDGTVLANVTLPGTTSGQVYTTVSSTVQLSAGKQIIRIYANSAAWNFNWWEYSDAAGSIVKPDSTTTNTGQNLTLYSAFESTADFSKWSEEICRPTALTISSEIPARKGKTSARFEFAKSDVTSYNGYVRAEIHQDSPPDAENWYGFSSYLPTDFVKDPMAEKIAQWHEIPDWDLGENWRSPPISLGIQNDRYTLQILWAAAKVNTNDTKDGEKDIDLGPVDKGKWNDFVFHIKFSYKSDGILEIYKNKVKIFSLYGPNSFNDENYPYFKVGIYKWTWNGWASYSPESKRVLYVDEVRIGNSKSNLNEVSPQ
ncbi:heparin lyase I family protein [Puia sp.]|jgi:hypothetical protein|uniref:heparin lyase I family protein n=1 Tax=Puia sp. TaxID=2045100 RepID=UPI002F41E263